MESHHFGIETLKVADRFAIHGVAWNRTILELKLIFCSTSTWPPAAWNRTILELKHFPLMPLSDSIVLESHHFGIETIKNCVTTSIAITWNRTILELKLFWALWIEVRRSPWNRTILELKPT